MPFLPPFTDRKTGSLKRMLSVDTLLVGIRRIHLTRISLPMLYCRLFGEKKSTWNATIEILPTIPALVTMKLTRRAMQTYTMDEFD